MITELILSTDSLNDGKSFSFDDELSSSVLSIDEKEIAFADTIKIQGTAYIASDELIVHFNARTTVFLPCKICNQMTPVILEVKNAYYTEDLKALKAQVNLVEPIREALLLEIPLLVECHDNHCPHRDEIAKYLTQETENPSPEMNKNPFSKFFTKD